MSRSYNFGAGPATLPLAILNEVQSELLNWHDEGMSILEMGHRYPPFLDLLNDLERLLRELLGIPSHYHVLFLGGAARAQFGMIPMNFLGKHEQAGYCVTGLWSDMAYQEACKLKKAYVVTSSETQQFTTIADETAWHIEPNTRYVYFTPNETVNGIRFKKPPRVEGIPLIADMTSCLLSEPIDVKDYDLIFAGAQKNIANAGLTLVIAKDEWIDSIHETGLPTMYDYRTHVASNSLYATLPTFNCYMAHKMFQWVKAQGGVEALYHINQKKAKALYDCIDRSALYDCRVEKPFRSLMNVCFYLNDPELEAPFLLASKKNGLLALQGHRHVGGMRASIYNAMPMEGVNALVEFMHDFEKAL